MTSTRSKAEASRARCRLHTMLRSANSARNRSRIVVSVVRSSTAVASLSATRSGRLSTARAIASFCRLNTFPAARFAAHDRAEEHIFLHRCGRIVALGVEELDRTAEIVRQPLRKDAARLEDPLLHLFVDELERITRGYQLECDRQQFFSWRLQEALDPSHFHALKDGFKLRQIVGADKTELLEEFVFGT